MSKSAPSLDDLYKKIGVEGFNEALAEICEACRLHKACKKSKEGCRALNIICIMGAYILGNTPAKAPAYLKRIKKAEEILKMVEKRRKKNESKIF